MRLAFVFCCCLFSLNFFGQKEFKGGIVFGPTTTQISGDGLGGWDKFGLSAGAWVNIPLGDKLGLGLSMKYINKGSRTKRDTLTNQSFGFYLNYIDVPLLLTYDVSTKKSQLTFSIGPYVGIMMNQKIKYNGADLAIDIPFNKTDIGAQLGIAYWMSQKLFVEFDVATSVLPTRPNPSKVNPGSYYEKGTYNQTLQLLIGLRFGGGTKEKP